MPRGKRVKKEKKTHQVIQTVKVVVGDVGRSKRKYKKRSAPKRISPASEVQGGLKNTIYGEPVPLPPRIIEVPVPYRLTEGATPSSGVFPQRPPPPAIEPPTPSMPSMPAITAAEKPKTMITFPSPSSAIDAIDEGETEMIRTALKKKAKEFYKPFERRGGEAFGYYNMPERPSQPIITEPLSLQKSMTSPQESMIVDLGQQPEEMVTEVKAEKPSLLKTVLKGATTIAGTLAAGAIDKAFKQPVGTTKGLVTAGSTIASSAVKYARGKPVESSDESLLSSAGEIAAAGADYALGKPIGTSKTLVGELIKSEGEGVSSQLKKFTSPKKIAPSEPIVEYATEEELKPMKPAAPAPKKAPARAKWNINDQMVGAYTLQTNMSFKDSEKALAALQKKYPNLKRKDVINAILNGDTQLNTLA